VIKISQSQKNCQNQVRDSVSQAGNFAWFPDLELNWTSNKKRSNWKIASRKYTLKSATCRNCVATVSSFIIMCHSALFLLLCPEGINHLLINRIFAKDDAGTSRRSPPSASRRKRFDRTGHSICRGSTSTLLRAHHRSPCTGVCAKTKRTTKPKTRRVIPVLHLLPKGLKNPLAPWRLCWSRIDTPSNVDVHCHSIALTIQPERQRPFHRNNDRRQETYAHSTVVWSTHGGTLSDTVTISDKR